MSKVQRITVEQLNEKMNDGKGVFILDVRNEEDYREWKIEGKQATSINVPYFHFLEEDENHFKDLPRDRDIVVVCAKGGSSEFIVDLLKERGYRGYSLQEAMLAWSQFYHPTAVAEENRMQLIQINRLSKGCLSYVIVSDGKAMIVDPNLNIDVYQEMSRQQSFSIEHVVDSHLHADHISGGPRLAQATGATYYISSSEAKGTDLAYEPLEHHREIRFGNVQVDVLAIPTPGHTPGSTSFLVNGNYLLSGDTIFVGGLGRPDLGGKAKEWAQDLYDTVFGKLNDLADDVLVLPAHYADIREMNERGIVGATLGDIRNDNEIMRTQNREVFTEYVAGAVTSEKPPNFEEIIAINRGELQVDPEKAIDLEIGPNRCAVHHHSN
ncbi:MBL fold metallo-hydrolase [Paenibacillus chartarius]|uniref:MBL fold metallo-hydrolase n=1 Tax=Paenibacillus chartarius TaxID=747481 RepID=A0ABV6DP42_9BACL